MSGLPRAQSFTRAGDWNEAADRVVLDYEGRFLRRRRLTTKGGLSFLADLAETTSLQPGDAFRLEDGRHIEVVGAEEALLVVRGDTPRLAWHIGNRHTPCQICPDRLVIRHDHVLQAMLERLGAEVTPARGPFLPEGGAYGMGRTMGHDHGHDHGASHHHHSHRHAAQPEAGE